MTKIRYSPDAVEALQRIEQRIREVHGYTTARKTVKKITERIRSLEEYCEQGVSMYNMYGVLPDYRRLYTAHNYIFYCIEDDMILIVNIYHEKEDFMQKLFGTR